MVVVVGWGLQSHFRVQPNNCVEIVLHCVVVGVVTIKLIKLPQNALNFIKIRKSNLPSYIPIYLHTHLKILAA